jgi:2-phosphosulfolactate phosphatase
MAERPVSVALLPQLVPPGSLDGRIAVVIDVLRATTTMIAALAAGCDVVVPCMEVEDAIRVAEARKPAGTLLCGERGGKQVPGFDLGNSPLEYTPAACKGVTVVMTTTNGTAALLRAAEAARVLVGAFVNYSAVCEQLRLDARPVALICAGERGEPSLEDTLFAGAVVDYLCETGDIALNDSARLAWDAFENHGRILAGALAVGNGGSRLIDLGYAADVAYAAVVDRFALVPELRGDPPRVERGTVGIVQSHWPR